jgi:hypothetical protein
MNPNMLDTETLYALLTLSLLGLPLWVITFLTKRTMPAPAPHRRARTSRRLSPAALAATDAAVASVLSPDRPPIGLVSLHCRECGGESPPVPVKRTAVTTVGAGYVVVATCRACGHPLVSRVLDAAKATEFLDAGAVDEVAIVERFRRELADL